jgi:dihydroflavonol-4-reductase
MSLPEIFEILSGLTGIKAPRLKLPQQVVLPLAYLNHWVAEYLTHRPPRIPLDGVRMAKYCMHYDGSKAVRELGLPQTPIETALKKAVQWFRVHGYA